MDNFSYRKRLTVVVLGAQLWAILLPIIAGEPSWMVLGIAILMPGVTLLVTYLWSRELAAQAAARAAERASSITRLYELASQLIRGETYHHHLRIAALAPTSIFPRQNLLWLIGIVAQIMFELVVLGGGKKADQLQKDIEDDLTFAVRFAQKSGSQAEEGWKKLAEEIRAQLARASEPL